MSLPIRSYWPGPRYQGSLQHEADWSPFHFDPVVRILGAELGKALGQQIVIDNRPGGSTIITNVFQNLSNVLDFGMGIARAVSAPRIHHQHLPDEIGYEPGSLSAATIAMVSFGIYKNFGEIGRMLKKGNFYRPNPDNKAVYDKLYKHYQALYKNNKGAFKELNH